MSDKFAKLRTDGSANWTLATQGQVPDKPFLLLAVLDLFVEAHIITNLIEITSELGELFLDYWDLVLPDLPGNLALHFFHTVVSPKYQVLLSKELRMMQNLPGHLLTVENCQILDPGKDDLWSLT